MKQLILCSLLLALSLGMLFTPKRRPHRYKVSLASKSVESSSGGDGRLMEELASKGLNACRPPQEHFDLAPFLDILDPSGLERFLKDLSMIHQATADIKLVPAGQPLTQVSSGEAREIVALGLIGKFPLDLLNFKPDYIMTKEYPMLKSILNYLTGPRPEDYLITFKLASLNLGSPANVQDRLGSAFPGWSLSQGLIGKGADREVSLVFMTNAESFQTMLYHGRYNHRVMAVHPDLIVAAHIMREGFGPNQGLYVSGHRAYSSPKGEALQDQVPLQAVFIAAAGDYTKDTWKQYEAEEIFGELVKATAAFSAVPAGETIATGRWGCGGYGGNAFLKFVIQMLAASITGHKLHFYLPSLDQAGLKEPQQEFFESFCSRPPAEVMKALLKVCQGCIETGSHMDAQMLASRMAASQSEPISVIEKSELIKPIEKSEPVKLAASVTVTTTTTATSSTATAPLRGLALIWPATKEFIERRDYLMEASQAAANSSRFISYQDDFKYEPLPKDTFIDVIDSDTISAASKYAAQGNKVLIVNFANNYGCGGSYKKDVNAQEEDIFRRSTAAFALSTEYLMQRNNFYPIAKGQQARAVITDHLRVLRKSRSEGFAFVDEQEQYEFSMITVGAYDYRYSERIMFQPDTNLLNEAGVAVMKKRIALIFQAAHQLGCDTVIAGALGCGAFMNNPEQIAKLHQEVIKEYPKLVSQVIFAIPDARTDNYWAFASVFGQGKV